MKICYKHFILDIPDINIRQLNNKKKNQSTGFLILRTLTLNKLKHLSRK